MPKLKLCRLVVSSICLIRIPVVYSELVTELVSTDET
jgi:hypothetical protein